MQRTRPMESLNGFMNSFKQFEKKLEKLQDDVNFHGNTLSDLRVMVANLSVTLNGDLNYEEFKRPLKRNTAIQYDERYLEHPVRTRRKNAILPLPSKLKSKSHQDQKYGLRISKETPFHAQNTSMGAVGKMGKQHRGPRKTDTRKANTIRQQKSTVKKLSKHK